MRRAAVHSIDHFALNVPSLDEARRFFTAFGLDVRDVGQGKAGEIDLRALDGLRWGRVLPAARKSLAYLDFSCFEQDLEPIARQARDAGAKTDIDVAAILGERHFARHGLWFNDPDGNLIHVGVGPKTMPSSRTPFGRGSRRSVTCLTGS